ATVYIEDFPGDEAGVFGAQEQHRGGDLLGSPGTAQGNLTANFVSALWVGEGSGAHVGIDPAGGHTVYVDAVGSQFGREGFSHADDRALTRGVVTVKGL